MEMRYCVLAACVLNLAVAFCAGEDSCERITQKRRIIAAGWDIGNATIKSFASETNRFAQLPLDGMRFALYAKTKDGKKVIASPSKAMDGERWDVGIFDDQLDAARAISSLPNMKHCFIGVRGAPNKRIEWTDDKTWATVAHNFALLAKFAKDANFKGIIFDCEDYSKARQFYIGDGDPEWPVLRKLVRQRGREVYRAVFAAYPEITVFRWQFLNPDKAAFEMCADVRLHREMGRRSLSYDFIDGLYDVLPSTARIVAAEEHLYDRLAEKGEMFRGYALEKRYCADMVDPIHRSKYLLQTSVGFALYLDAFRADNTKSPYYRKPDLYGSHLNCLLANVEQAVKATDEYVWLWGEKRGWAHWNWSPVWTKRQTWEEELPGLSEGLFRIKNPIGYAKWKLGKLRAEKAKNMLPNGDCASLDGYGFWHREKRAAAAMTHDPETGCREKGALLLTDMRGCATFFVNGLNPSERYLVAVRCKAEDDAGFSASIRWRKDGKWDFGLTGCLFENAGVDADGWMLLTGIVEVPKEANGLGLLLTSESRKGQKVWFDDCEMYRIP